MKEMDIYKFTCAGHEHIISQLGRGRFADVGTPVVDDSLVQVKLQAVTGNVEYPATLTVPGSGAFAYFDTLTNRQNDTFEAYWYHPDHLGSSSWITYTDGDAVQHLHYLPFGENFVDQKSNSFDGVRYTFSAKEKDMETGYSYFGAWYYSSELSIWLSVDPMLDKYPSLSPYVYCANNPVRLIDPDGTHIEVVENDNGTYTVQNGTINNDKKIYIVDGNGNRTGVLGEMLTTNSFFGDDGEVVKNAVINPNDDSGQAFLKEIKQNTPSLVYYAANARSSTKDKTYKYDFKSRDGVSKLNHYRGMPIGTNNGETIFASARDIGNVAAGYVAGYNGLTWDNTRMFFDGYQTISDKGVMGIFSQWSQEGMTSKLAQKYGFNMGEVARHNKITRAREMIPLLRR